MDTLTFSKVDSTELRRAGFEAAAKMCNLLQYTVEYLLHVQGALLTERKVPEQAPRCEDVLPVRALFQKTRDDFHRVKRDDFFDAIKRSQNVRAAVFGEEDDTDKLIVDALLSNDLGDSSVWLEEDDLPATIVVLRHAKAAARTALRRL